MKLRLFSLSFLVIACLLGSIKPVVAACDPDGEVEFVCGPLSPEDLVAVPETPWVVVSSMEDEGHIHVANTLDHSTLVVFPTETSRQELDTSTYSACPGPLTDQFRPHGLSLRPGRNGRHTLYVVGHGAREAVEVFTLDTSGSEPSATWIGCVVAPQGVSLNSVTALPDGAFAVTNFNMAAGELWEWQTSVGWEKVPGSTMPGPNGLTSSTDGRWFYIGGWGEESLVRLSRGQTPVRKDVVNVGFHVDNVRKSPDGSLLVAGQYAPDATAIFRCLSGAGCEGVSTRVARIDLDRLSAEQLIDYPSNDLLILGTVALQVGDEIWVGAIAGGGRIGRFKF